MVSLLFMIFVAWNNSENPYCTGIDTAPMIGFLSFDMTLLFAVDKIFF